MTTGLLNFATQPTAGFSQVYLGAGGMLTGVSIGSDGTTAVRTDTYGAWISPSRLSGWYQAVSATSMPSTADSGDAMEIVIAPSNPAIMYMLLTDGNVYYSLNRGITWTKTAFTGIGTINGWGDKTYPKQFTSFMAVDPKNANIVILGTPSNGVYYTTGGTTNGAWTSVSGIGTATLTGVRGTSSTSFSSPFGTGSKTFTTATSIGLGVGAAIQIYSTSNPTNTMTATVTSDTGTTLVVNVSASSGSGTNVTDWSIADGEFASNLVCFDPSSSFSGSATQGVYIAVNGWGVYHSTTGVSGTFSLVTGTGMPLTQTKMICDQFGNVWVIDGNQDNSGFLNVYPHSGSTIFTVGQWTQPTTGGTNNACSVAVDPSQVTESGSRIYIGTNNNALLCSSHNGGGIWVVNATPTLTGPANGIPWQWNYGNTAFPAGNNNYAGSMINLVFDPSLTNTLLAASGIGLWITNPTNDGTTAWQWTEQSGHGTGSTGIEELVLNEIVSPWTAGSTPLAICWDRPVFQIPSGSSYPTKYGPGIPNPFSIPPRGWSADWASSNPSIITVMTDGISAASPYGDTSAVSTDGGNTWTVWPNLQSSGYGGSIAAYDANNWVIFTSNSGHPQYTTNGASTAWNDLGTYFNTNFGIPTSGQNGWSNVYFNNNQIVACDRVHPNTFYAWNFGNASSLGTYGGIYVSTSSGSTWTRYTPTFSFSNAAIGVIVKSVPNKDGHVFISFGSQYNVGDPLYFCTNAYSATAPLGQNWTAVTNVTDVAGYGFGAVSPSSSTGYPTIYLYGKVSGTQSLWRGDNFNSSTGAATWTNLSPVNGFVNNSLDVIKCVEGDANTYGTVYVGFGGTGIIKYHL